MNLADGEAKGTTDFFDQKLTCIMGRFSAIKDAISILTSLACIAEIVGLPGPQSLLTAKRYTVFTVSELMRKLPNFCNALVFNKPDRIPIGLVEIALPSVSAMTHYPSQTTRLRQ